MTQLFLKILFLIVSCPDKYATLKMCDAAVNDSVATLKLIPDWLVTSKMMKTVFTASYADQNTFYFNEDSSYVEFNCNGMVISDIDFNNTNLDNNFDKYDPDTIIILRHLDLHIKLETRNAHKNLISEELMPIAWFPKRWWNFCMPEDEKKERKLFKKNF